MSSFEPAVEESGIEWLQGLGWAFIDGPGPASDASPSRRAAYRHGTVNGRLRRGRRRKNERVSACAVDEVARSATLTDWMLDTMDACDRVFRRRLKKLDPAGWSPPPETDP